MTAKEIKKLPQVWHPAPAIKSFMEKEQTNALIVPAILAYAMMTAIKCDDSDDAVYDEAAPVWLRTTEAIILLGNIDRLSEAMSMAKLHRCMQDLLFVEVDKCRKQAPSFGRKLLPFASVDENYDYRVGRLMEDFFMWLVETAERY